MNIFRHRLIITMRIYSSSCRYRWYSFSSRSKHIRNTM